MVDRTKFLDGSGKRVVLQLFKEFASWLEVRNHVLIKPHIEKWQAELEVKLRSEAIQQMKNHAKQPGGTAAAKWLADKGYAQEGPKKVVGRPKKEEDIPTPNLGRIAGDMARLGIVVGGKH